MTQTADDDHAPEHAASATAAVIAGLELYGYRPAADEPDLRPLPEDRLIAGAVADIFDALIAALADTRLETELEDLLWGQANLFHRAVGRIERDLDANEAAQKQSQREQDGSELRSVELERLIEQGQGLIERRAAMELFRDTTIELYERQVGAPWRGLARQPSPHDRRHDRQPRFSGRQTARRDRAAHAGRDQNRLHWRARVRRSRRHLERARQGARQISRHGAGAWRAPKGAECIAAAWARNRGVTQIVFKPDWTRHAKAAPFKRNDRMLETLPTGLIAFPGSGISANLADKAKKIGIPVWTFDRACKRR